MERNNAIEIDVKEYARYITTLQKMEDIRKVAFLGGPSSIETMKTKMECIRSIVGKLESCSDVEDQKQEDHQTLTATDMDGTERYVSV